MVVKYLLLLGSNKVGKVYIKKIHIENYGSLKNFDLDMPFNVDATRVSTTPKPLIIVGKNGTGKTIILSHIVNNFIMAKQSVYDDCEIEKGFVYKVRSPLYINDSYFSYARIDFDTNDYTIEYQLSNIKKNIVSRPEFVKPNNDWDLIQEGNNSFTKSTITDTEIKAKELIDNRVVKYFPSDRSSEPAWLNKDALIKSQSYSQKVNFSNISNRSIIAYDEFEDNKRWIMDLILDREIYSKKTQKIVLPISTQPDGTKLQIIQDIIIYTGVPEILYLEVLKIINTIFRKSHNHLRLGISNRSSRKLEIIRTSDEKQILPNISQLSLGESLLLNLFLSIIRDADNSNKNITTLSEISGIVLIDEIENHLHNDLVAKALPELIKLFPKIQFIITSHSPIFLLGMEQTFKDNMKIIELNSIEPNGYEDKTAEQFSEFQDAFDMYQNTNSFNDKINHLTKPVVIAEGETDPQIIKKAWTILNPSVSCPFEIIGLSSKTGSGAPAIRAILEKIRSLPIPIIGLFDADDGGEKAFSDLKGFTSLTGNLEVKLKESNVFATCLPVPVTKSYMKGKAEGFEIEDYFPDSSLTGKSVSRVNIIKDNHGNETQDATMPTYLKFSGNKTDFARSVQDLDNTDGKFNNFQILFDRLEAIINPTP